MTSPKARKTTEPSPATTGRRLAGERVLITRAREQAEKLASALREQGAEIIEVPSIAIQPPTSFQPLDAALHRAEDYDWLILTSVNGVRSLFSRLEALGFGAEKLLHLNIAAIGPATREEIEKHGLPVDVVPEEYVAESVVSELRHEVKGKRVLLVRAKIARDVIPTQLQQAGAHVDVIEAYETVVPEQSRAHLREVLTDPKRRPTIITFTSSSTARNFLELLGDSDRHTLDGITIASIGPVTSDTLRHLGLHVDVEAREFTIPGLVKALLERHKQ